MKLATVVATTGLLAGTVLAGASPAQATEGCSAGDEGKYKKNVGSASYHWLIPEPQHDIEENYSGKTEELTFRLDRGRSATDSVKVNAEVSGSFKAGIFGDLEAKAGTELGHVGQESEFTSVTRTFELKSGDTYHFAGGSGFWRAHAVVYRCQKGNAGGDFYEWVKIGEGPVTGFLGTRRTVVGCEVATDPGTLAREIKNRYC